MGDFSSMDNASYSDALNSYFTAENAGQEQFNDAKAAADAKVAKFNEILSTPLESVGSIATAKGIGKLLPKVKAGINNAFKGIQARAKQALEDSKQAGNDALDKMNGDDVGEPPSNPGDVGTQIGESPDGIELQDASSFSSGNVTNPSSSPDASVPEDEFAPENMPSGSGGRVDLGEQSDPADSNTGSASASSDGTDGDALAESNVDSVAENATSQAASSGSTGAATAGDAAGEAGAEAAGDAALDTTAAVAGSEGGLNPIADLAVLGVGLGMIFGGIFGKKHASTPPPPMPINPSFQAGA